MTFNECLKFVNEAKEYERLCSYHKAGKKYQKAKKGFKELKENKLYARCLRAYCINMIKYYLEGRNIEALSVNIIESYIKKIKDGIEGAGLDKLEKYNILISAYQELEKIFKNHYMNWKANEMYFERTKLYHKYFWARSKTHHTNFEADERCFERTKLYHMYYCAKCKARGMYEKIKDIFNSIFRCLFYCYCGNGERLFRAVLISIAFILVFSGIFKCFGLIQFSDYKITIPPCYFQSLYFSVVTFTTLGYGDIIPKGGCGQFFVAFEVFMGYLMLGALIAVIIRKITR